MRFIVIDSRTGEKVTNQHRYNIRTNGGLWKDHKNGLGNVPVSKHYVACQLIGKQDKSGEELYEGAVVTDGAGNTYIIKWQNDKCKYSLFYFSKASGDFDWVNGIEIGKDDDLTLVGNKYEKAYREVDSE